MEQFALRLFIKENQLNRYIIEIKSLQTNLVLDEHSIPLQYKKYIDKDIQRSTLRCRNANEIKYILNLIICKHSFF